MNTDITAMQELIDFCWKSLDTTPLTIIRFAEKLLETESKKEKLFTIEQVAVICSWIFEGDYIHTLTNKNDTNKEIRRLVKHYSDSPELEQNLKNK